jgi:hypothetical protein
MMTVVLFFVDRKRPRLLLPTPPIEIMGRAKAAAAVALVGKDGVRFKKGRRNLVAVVVVVGSK